MPLGRRFELTGKLQINNFDTIISIRLANVTSNMVLASAFMTSSGATGENIGSDFEYKTDQW